MDPRLYQAIRSRNIEDLKQLIASDDTLIHFDMTPLKNTALHVAAQFCEVVCVEEICNTCPSLLMQQNLKGDTPLHIAARLGSSDIVAFLIHCAQIHHGDIERGHQGGETLLQQLVRTANKENDTALHEAVRYHQLDIVKLLTEADLEFQYFANNVGETPLYLAVEDQLYDIVDQILWTCPSSAHGGPGGRTVLHAAASTYNSEIVQLLLDKKPAAMVKEANEQGCTALHFAARYGNLDMVKQLLVADHSVAYMKDKDGRTALHVAARFGIHRVIQLVDQYCPDCLELVDNKGQNFLHLAAEKGKLDVIKCALEKPKMVENLVNEKDNDGNTPFHLVFRSYDENCLKTLNCESRVNKRIINKDNLTAYDLALNTLVQDQKGSNSMFMREVDKDLIATFPIWNRRQPYIRKKLDKSLALPGDADIDRKYVSQIERMKNMNQTHVLVAALIATVTFAAGFTLPGGYNNSDGPHKGMAILIDKPAFVAFVVSNSLAMLLSLSTVVVHFCFKDTNDITLKTILYVAKVTFLLTNIAIKAMAVAFVTGTYTVLSVKPGLAIPLCVLGCMFFLVFSYLRHKVVKWVDHDGVVEAVKKLIKERQSR